MRRQRQMCIRDRDKIPPFISAENQPDIVNESALANSLSKYYDPEYGGFGSGQKFPPHSSLLFLFETTYFSYSLKFALNSSKITLFGLT